MSGEQALQFLIFLRISSLPCTFCLSSRPSAAQRDFEKAKTFRNSKKRKKGELQNQKSCLQNGVNCLRKFTDKPCTMPFFVDLHAILNHCVCLMCRVWEARSCVDLLGHVSLFPPSNGRFSALILIHQSWLSYFLCVCRNWRGSLVTRKQLRMPTTSCITSALDF